MKVLSLILFLLFAQQVSCQVISISTDNIGEVEFKSEYLSENQITSITIENHVKRRGEGLVKMDEYEKFYFEKGQIKEKREFFPNNGKIDSLRKEFSYLLNQYSTLTYSPSGSKVSVNTYYDNDLPIKMEKVQILADSSEAVSFEVEFYEHSWLNDSTLYTVIKNSDKKPYKSVTKIYDKTKEFLLTVKHHYHFGNKKKKIDFQYNEKGYIKAIVINELERHDFQYSPYGELVVDTWTKPEQSRCRIEYVYDDYGNFSAEVRKFEDSPTVYVKKYILEKY